MIYPLFGESLFGSTLFAEGLVTYIVIPVYNQYSEFVDYRVLEVKVVDSKIIMTFVTSDKTVATLTTHGSII